jgi:DNA repair protein RadD
MSLLNLISRLSATEKTQLLGSETEEILRYSFTEKDTDAIPKEIIDLAVANSKGASLILRPTGRKTLIESLNIETIQSLGHRNYDDAIKFYAGSFDNFKNDFSIEDKFCFEAPVDNRENSEFIIPRHGECNGKLAFPHPYQLRLKNKINDIIRTQYSANILATMPTGAGKTVLAMELIVDLFRSYKVQGEKKLQICWVVERQELCEQSLQSFQNIWKQKGDRKIICQRYFDRFTELNSNNENLITFATFTLLNSRLTTREVKEFLSQVDLLIIDEAHGANAFTYKEVLDVYEELSPTGFRLGLTATPFRNDDSDMQTLKDLFQTYLAITDDEGKEIESPMKYLIDEGYLSQIEMQVLNSERGSSNSEYFKNLHKAVAEECENLISRGENTIIFAQSKSHAIALNIYLKLHNIENELIIGETPTPLRKQYLERFGNKTNPLSVLVNHQILATGIDVPGMNSIMVLSQIESPTLALQIIGRAMRGEKNGGNKSNTVYLTRDNYNKLKELELLENIVLSK